MSRRVGGGRGKAKKDDLAKAAAEVLNNITPAPTPAVAHPATSGGLLRTAVEDGNVASDVRPKQLLVLNDQETSPPPPLSPSPPPGHHGLSTIRREPPSTHVAGPAGIGGQAWAGMHGRGAGGDIGGGAVGMGTGGGEGEGGGCSPGVRRPHSIPVALIPPPTPIPAADPLAPNWWAAFGRRTVAVGHMAAAAVKVVATHLRDELLLGISRLARPGPSSYTDVGDPGGAAALATPGSANRPNASGAAAAAAGLILLLVSLLLLSASSYSLARAARRAEGALRLEVGELRQQLLAWQRQAADVAAAANTDVRKQLQGARLEDQRLGVQLAELGSGLEAALAAVEIQAAEIRSLKHALEARDAVQSIVHGGNGGGGGDAGNGHNGTDNGGAVGTRVGGAPSGSSASTASGSAVESTAAAAALVGLEGSGDGVDLRGLPACHMRRLVAAAGPLLAARVTRHSAVTGDEGALMRFHFVMSHVFAPDGGPRVHPLARQLTNPAATRVCLPLAADVLARGHAASSGGAATAGNSDPSLELQLLTPANVTAISFHYPAYGTWDTSSALLHLSATVHEAPAIHGAQNQGAFADAPAAVVAPVGTGGLRSRHLELPPLRGVECQHVAIPPSPTPAVAAAAAAGTRFASGGGGGGSRMLVHGITLHVHSNFGNPVYACMPRVLVHGWAG